MDIHARSVPTVGISGSLALDPTNATVPRIIRPAGLVTVTDCVNKFWSITAGLCIEFGAQTGFQSPESQLRRLVTAVENARSGYSAGESSNARVATFSEIITVSSDVVAIQPDHGIEREKVVADPRDSIAVKNPYVEANFPINSGSASIRDIPVKELAIIVSKIVLIEGPIHGDETARRVTTLFGQSRSGSRISAAVTQALTLLVKRRDLIEEDGFYWMFNQQEFRIRDRENVTSVTLRKPESLPPIEIQEGVINFVNRHVGATIDECVRGLAREFGFRSTGQQLRQIIEKQIEFLVTNEVLTLNGTVLAKVHV